MQIYECKYHGLQLFSLGRKSLCQECKRLRKKSIRNDRKRSLVERFGGCCSSCGYNASNWALTFHHRDPDDKQFELSSNLEKYSMDALVTEALKCDLLCHNCHMQLHERLYHSGSIITYDLIRGEFNVAK